MVFHDSSQPLLRAAETPLGNLSFHAVPLGSSKDEIGPGLLLLTGLAEGPVSDDVHWVAELLGVRLASLWYRRAQTEERRHKRERSWLFSIINAVTDPILLTDADGRILVANAGAETLLDGRRGRERGAAPGGGPEQHAVLGLAVHQQRGGERPDPPRAAAGRPARRGRTCCSSC